MPLLCTKDRAAESAVNVNGSDPDSVIAEVTISVVLLVAAGLMFRALMADHNKSIRI